MSRLTLFVLVSMLCGAAASAETLRCQSVNGNLNCTGSAGMACQTINGRQVCSSGRGDVVQSFGNAAPSADADDDMELDPGDRQHIEQHRPGGHTMLLDRDGTSLHLRTDRPSIDRD